MNVSRLSIILALTAFAGAGPAVSNRALRIPLERRSRNGGDPKSATSEHFSGAGAAERLVSHAHRKYEATFAAYEKNTGSRHPLDTLSRSQIGLSERATSGSVDLVDDDSVMYYGSFSIGTPGQPFTAVFDTGSADIFVPDESCLVTCNGHKDYDPAKSSTSHSELQPVTLTYGSGAALVLYEHSDIVQVAGYTVVGQAFATADFLSDQFWNNGLPLSGRFPADGLFGCAFEEISSLNVAPPVENLNRSSQLPESFLSFMLSDVPGRSELIVGGADYSAFKHDTVVYTPVTVKGYWQITLGSISRSGYQVSGSIKYPAIVDTGTTLIIAPTSIANDYFSGVPGARCTSDGLCSVPCDTIDSTTPTFTIEGRDFSVCPSTWNFGPVTTGSPDCVTGMGVSDEFPFVIIGDVFLRNVYSIFDFGATLSVGFADLVDPVC